MMVLAAGAAFSSASAQWNPVAGQWGKTDPRDVRVMTYNIRDGINSLAPKSEGFNGWCALARTVAALKPDVLLMQETGDLGTGVDTVANLATTYAMFLHGGTDPFRGNVAVTSWVQKYAASYDLPFIYISDVTDGFNRNVVLSRFPLTDLNGDGRTQVSTFTVLTDLYVPTAGNSGIRGFIFAELDLPNSQYAGDLVVGCAHLRSGGQASDLAERLISGQRTAYYIDYLFNGGGTTTPDPRAKILDLPAATSVLSPTTPVIWGGDWNEDENTNGRDGPALWMSRAQATGDGTDRDRSDSSLDDSRDFFGGSRVTQSSGSKLDYIAWQDSIATLRRSHVFNSSTMSAGAHPPELVGFNGNAGNPNGSPGSVTGAASDHRPVFADFVLPQAQPQPGAFSLTSPADDAADVSLTPTLTWSASANAQTYTVTVSLSPSLSSPIHTAPGLATTSYDLPPGILSECGTYYWGVAAVNGAGSTSSSPVSRGFRTIIPADFNHDGSVDFFDYLDFVAAFDAEDPAADFNGDNVIDFFDYLDFAARFSDGC
jgi:endonuclease/exonuclease/phosphatase family metal-dependent hydrolase